MDSKIVVVFLDPTVLLFVSTLFAGHDQKISSRVWMSRSHCQWTHGKCSRKKMATWTTNFRNKANESEAIWTVCVQKNTGKTGCGRDGLWQHSHLRWHDPWAGFGHDFCPWHRIKRNWDRQKNHWVKIVCFSCRGSDDTGLMLQIIMLCDSSILRMITQFWILSHEVVNKLSLVQH